MKQSCIIVIPVYRAPDFAEQLSFRQVLTVLGKYDIAMVTHDSCDMTLYHKISQEVGKDFSMEVFDGKYFASVGSYNDLCFTSDFYHRFEDYDYMLIYQLDAWVFRDELETWCQKGYDYIGAPLYHAYTPERFTQVFLGIGNGGFSLRKISHCLRLTEAPRHRPFVTPWEMVMFYWNLGRYTEDFTCHPLRRLLIIPTVIGKWFGLHNTLDFYISHHINEDLIFGSWSNRSWGGSAHLPDEMEAAAFSFEVNPKMLYERRGKQLPFGCHAFMKWEYDSFWSHFISVS